MQTLFIYMLKVVDSNEISLLDKSASIDYKIPSIVLMENAALGVIHFIDEVISDYHKIDSVLILCGVGNNGGDGLAIARHLTNRGINVNVLIIGNTSRITKDAKVNLEILEVMEANSENLKIFYYKENILKQFKNFDLYIDSLFGTGLNSDIIEPVKSIIAWVNKKNGIKIAVDIPSGLNGTTGLIQGICFKADYTLTMGLLKTGLLINEGRKVAGETEVIDISLPEELVNICNNKINYLQPEDIEECLPKRETDVHKYSVGKVVVIGGSKEYIGAPVLAAESALAAGCGGVVLLTPENLVPVYAKKLKEVVYHSIGKNSKDIFSISDYSEIAKKIIWSDVIVIGPGLGKHPETQELLDKILIDFPRKKKIIDADGIVLLAELLKSKKYDLSNAVLTPHLGEFSILSGLNVSVIKKDIIYFGKDFSKKAGCTLVLKGAPTIIFGRSGEIYINSTGNPGMATMGMGDVLSGIIAGLTAQKLELEKASYSGTFIHGLTGDLVIIKKTVYSLTASDIITNLFQAFKIITENN